MFNLEICICSPQPHFARVQWEDEAERYMSLWTELLSPSGDTSLSLGLLLFLSQIQGCFKTGFLVLTQELGREKAKISELGPLPQSIPFLIAITGMAQRAQSLEYDISFVSWQPKPIPQLLSLGSCLEHLAMCHEGAQDVPLAGSAAAGFGILS